MATLWLRHIMPVWINAGNINKNPDAGNEKFQCEPYRWIFQFLRILRDGQAGLFLRKIKVRQCLICLDGVDSGGWIAEEENHDRW